MASCWLRGMFYGRVGHAKVRLMAGGILCIENWSGHIASQDSVLPLLEFIRRSDGARFIHQRIQTRQELAHYLARFTGMASYQVGYLALHGSQGGVWVGAQRVSLEELSEWAELGNAPAVETASGEEVQWVLDFSGKILYLGSCASLNVPQKRFEGLRKETGAIAVCGYTRSVDWFESAAFELMLLSELANAMDKKRHTARASIKRLRRRAGDLMDNLGFVSAPPWHEKA